MSQVEPQVSEALMMEIKKIEAGTDLKRVAVITKTGMAIASATNSALDASEEAAYSTALIALGEKLSDSVGHGALREILVRADSGFVILQFINEEYMIFGGISNPLKIGYYMEYLRSRALFFAFLLAGNQLTDELKKEIDAQKTRDEKIKEEKKAPLSAHFKMDKNKSSDMAAMEGVLDFLKDWGEEEKEIKPSADNIVGIDKDLLFGVDNLAPTPISQDQIANAQKASVEIQAQENAANSPPKMSSEEEAALDAIAKSLAGGVGPTPEPVPVVETNIPAPSVPNEDAGSIGLPQEILASLDIMAPSAPKTKPTKAAKSGSSPTELPFGILIYEGEVPPVPLEDYTSFEVGALTKENTPEPADVDVNADTPEVQPTAKAPPLANSEQPPDFNSMASEYDDPDINLEEDAMLDALNELGMTPDKKKKKN